MNNLNGRYDVSHMDFPKGDVTLRPGSVSLPSNAGTFDPTPYLREEMQAAFRDPRLIENPEPPDAKASLARRAKFHCKDKAEFFADLDEAGMLEAERPAVLRLAGFGSHDTAGAFAVSKSATSQRFVTNRKPRNRLEVSIGTAADWFPHGTCFCDMRLQRGECVRGSGDDLPDYYHSIRGNKLVFKMVPTSFSELHPRTTAAFIASCSVRFSCSSILFLNLPRWLFVP